MKMKNLLLILFAFSVLNTNAQVCFNQSNAYTIGSNTFTSPTVMFSDLNGDNILDSVFNSFVDKKVFISLGDGNNGYGNSTMFQLPDYYDSVVSLDFNLDGKLDLGFHPANNIFSYGFVVLLNNMPTIIANATEDTICHGTSIVLTGSGGTVYSWTNGVTNNVSFTPSVTTTYTVTGTINNCSNTTSKTIYVNQLPTATFTSQNETSSLYCDGTIKVHLTNISSIQWVDSSQNILSITDSIGPLCSGVYTLHVTDSNNCANTFVNVINGQLPQTPPICLITVDNTLTHNLLIWEKTNLNLTVIDSFIVYKEITSNNYQRIGAIHKDSLSTFDDFQANPSTTGFRYKLKSKNEHGALSLFSNYHNTIYLTDIGGNFSWTPYQVENDSTPVSTYHVYRDDNSTGNFVDIGNTTGNQFGFTDINYSSFPNANYYVEAVMASGACNPTRSSFPASRSNVKHSSVATGVLLINKLIINTYPNPVSNKLTISGVNTKTNLQLYNIVGQLIVDTNIDSDTELDVTQITNGIYTLLINNGLALKSTKININH